MGSKEVFLYNEDGGRLWLEQKPKGSPWQDGEEIFATEGEAGKRGRKVDAVKVRWRGAGGDQKSQYGDGGPPPESSRKILSRWDTFSKETTFAGLVPAHRHMEVGGNGRAESRASSLSRFTPFSLATWIFLNHLCALSPAIGR
jgi:hypothetical protein